MSSSMTVGFPGGMKVVAHYDGFEIMTDQCPEDGGEGSAPQPFDLFLASLATCAGYYVLKFCEKRGIAHDGIRVGQTWERDKDGKISTISVTIELPPSFPEKYRTAVVRAAGQCSVKKTMESPPEMKVESVVASD